MNCPQDRFAHSTGAKMAQRYESPMRFTRAIGRCEGCRMRRKNGLLFYIGKNCYLCLV